MIYFMSVLRHEWFEDPFVCQMIQEIDKTEVLGNGAFQSPVLGIISSDRLSGSVKTLIILYELPAIKLWGSACGMEELIMKNIDSSNLSIKKITRIIGDSATGKTELLRLLFMKNKDLLE